MKRWTWRKQVRSAIGRAIALGPGLAIATIAVIAPSPSRAAADRAVAASANWRVVATVSSPFLPPLGGVVAPVDMAVLPDGGFVVVDDALRRAQRFDADGGVVAGYGAGMGEVGAMEAPFGVAVDSARGRVYLADTLGRAVLVFGMDGGLIARWDGFPQPEAATVGLDGRLYVYDRSKAALMVRRPDGAVEADITVQRALSFSSELPIGLATSARGSLFFAAENPVADQANILYEFTADGDVVSPRTQLRWRIRDIAFDAAGEMLLLDWTNGRVVSRLDRSMGAIGREWPIQGHPVALAARAADEAWLLYGASPAAPASVAVIAGGREARRFALPRPPADWFAPPLRLQADDDGRLWVVDEMDRAVRIDPRTGKGDVQFTLPGLQEVVPSPDGTLVTVIRTRSSSSADDPDDADAPPPGTRRVHFEQYVLRPGADPGVDLSTKDVAYVETAVGDGDAIVVAASDADRAGRTAWALDIGRGMLVHHRVGPGVPESAFIVPQTPYAATDFRDVVVLDESSIGLLQPAARRIVVVGPLGDLRREIQLDVDSPPRRIARLADGRLAVLTQDDAVAILGADGRREAVIALPRPARAGDEPAADIAAAGATVYVADRLDRAIYVFAEVGAPRIYLPWAGAGARQGG
ncbi:MAG: hypothetical protein ABI780_06825 [Ardenticatenales bacterium]